LKKDEESPVDDAIEIVSSRSVLKKNYLAWPALFSDCTDNFL
jgi:hypothetical protein